MEADDRSFEVKTHGFEGSWDAIWRTQWFTRDGWLPTFRSREDFAHLRGVAACTMPQPEVRRVLDCTSGLGTKSIVLTEMGYEVEGADASREGVRIARRLAAAEGHEIAFRVQRWDELRVGPYDAVYSDAYDLAPDRSAVAIAQDWVRCLRWSFADFAEALTDAGFRDVDSVKVPGFPERVPWITNIARA